MTLNSWLCKTFDEENTGDVTICDIVCYILSKILTETNIILGFVFIVIPIFFGFLYYTSKLSSTDNYTTALPKLMGTDNILIALSMMWIIGIIFYIILIIFYYILKLKVAKCPLKKEDNE